MVYSLGKRGDIDRSFYNKLIDDAVEVISKYCDFEWFVSDDPYVSKREKWLYPDCEEDELPFN